ncbi:MAG: hypothetical protein IJ258_09750 [Methanobrevibacter sp.]|uniref:hypothetical protein n=1 Tax=Methanobrevibacter sp. TaxID=66852 RepID=UPI0025E81617|nr:hypothetical protein [Methanobrevibacter sp.]MBQ8018369.1 hypothetical protein [Methanobrevibacter sp.]
MLNKKILLLMIIIACFFSSSVVFANENLTNTSEIISYPDNLDNQLEVNYFSFSSLNYKINSNNESSVTLNEDYKFDLNIDNNFKSGIVINRSVNIIGNGHTIDGAGVARIFNITASDVFISNISFINANADNGAAINSQFNPGLISCNFTNNKATLNGGAMYGGTASNCKFESNSASRGGAIYNGVSQHSTFISNVANDGGALFNSYAEYSVFNSNYANSVCGAMSGGSALNCTYIRNQAKNSYGAGEFYAKNCIFIENSAYNVGALKGEAEYCIFRENYALNEAGAMRDSKAENCTFINNHAIIAGAMEGGSAINCVFNYNNADNYGGALCNVYAKYCNFTGNSAYQGGAMYDNSAEMCIFVSNNANEGGALYHVSSESCKFISNSAKNGGAISLGSTRSSTFERNSASENGGALLSTSAFLCSFEGNSAKTGGAMYGGSAIQCDFEDNQANFGGAIAGDCSASNCNFTDNIAIISGGANYQASIVNCNLAGNLPKYKLSLSGFEAIYGFGGELNVKLSDSLNTQVKGIKTIIDIYDSHNNLVETDSCLSGYSCFVDLGLGEYTAVVRLNDENYVADPVSSHITIKTSSFIYVVGVTATYDINNPLIVNLHDSKGVILKNTPVSIKINGVSKTYWTNNNGQVLMSTVGLAPNVYNAIITYAGSNIYFSSTATAKVTIKKANPIMIASKMTYKSKVKTKKYSIILKNNVYKVLKNTQVTLKINKKTYSAKTNSKGKATFKIKKLTKKGTYKAQIKYSGNGYYNALTKTVKITVKK